MNGRFTIASVYEAIRQHVQKPVWQKVLWRAPCVPKHSFITWMALLNRLPTMDRLISWGLNFNPVCKLCNQDSESNVFWMSFC